MMLKLPHPPGADDAADPLEAYIINRAFGDRAWSMSRGWMRRPHFGHNAKRTDQGTKQREKNTSSGGACTTQHGIARGQRRCGSQRSKVGQHGVKV